MTHAELEDRLSADAREVFRQLFQDHVDLRAEHEERLEGVAGAEGVVHGAVEGWRKNNFPVSGTQFTWA